MRLRQVAATCFALLVIGAGTSTVLGQNQPTAPPVVAATTSTSATRVSNISQAALPLDTYRLTDSQRAQISEARRILLRQCATQFHLSLPIHKAVPDTGPVTRTERRYGISDAKLAASDGYHLGSRDPRKTNGRDTWLDSVTPDIESVLRGTRVKGGTARPTSGSTKISLHGRAIPKGGCLGQASKALHDAEQDPAGLVDRLDGQSWTESRQAAQTRTAAVAWSTCMRNSGFHYSDPIAAGNDRRFQGPQSSVLERRTAVADIECKKSTHFIDAWYNADVQVQQRLIQENSKALAAVRSSQILALDSLKRIMHQTT